MSRRAAFSAPRPSSRSAFATVALGMGAAVVGGVTVVTLGGGLLAAVGVYMLTGATAMTGVGVVQAARPLRPRLNRLATRLRHPVAILTH